MEPVAAAVTGPAMVPRASSSFRAPLRQLRGGRVRTSAGLRAAREQRTLGREIVSRSLKRQSSACGLLAAEPRLKRLRGARHVTSAATATAFPSPSRHKIDQKALLRRVLRVVHPDKYMANPQARDVNSQALKASAQYTVSGTASVMPLPAIMGRQHPSFVVQTLNGYVEELDSLGVENKWRIRSQQLKFLVSDGGSGTLREVCSLQAHVTKLAQLCRHATEECPRLFRRYLAFCQLGDLCSRFSR